MRGAIYARYSAGPRQTDQSIEGQLRVCRSFCEGKGIQVVGEYCDRHISGRTDERPEFQRLIQDAKLKKFEAVIVYKTDRFARNKYDSAIYKRELKKAGVQIFYAAEAIPEGPEGIILESLMEGLAEYYSAELAQKIRRGMNESALKCQSTGPGCPLGYKIDDQKHFQVDQDAAEIVRTIFDMFNKGIPNAQICEFMNSRGLRTKRGNPFDKNSINRIIKNRKYIGEYRYQDVVVPGGIPAIITPEVFSMAQAEMERRRTRKKPASPRAEYLLSGKLHCGYCKSLMQGVSGTGHTGKKWYYYYCPNNRGKKRDCEKTQVPRDILESLVANLTVTYILNEETLSELAAKVYEAQEVNNDKQAQIDLYTRKLAEIKKGIANIVKVIEAGTVTASLPARLEALEQEQTVVEGELQFLRNARPEFSEDQILFMLMQYLDPFEGEDDQAYRKRIITCFVSEVYLYNDRIIIFFNISSPDGKLQSLDLEGFDERLNSSTILVAGRTHIAVLPYGFVLAAALAPISRSAEKTKFPI